MMYGSYNNLNQHFRILYLQQLGRVIYELDEDNPLPNDKRPVVIDLANNSLTVKIEKDKLSLYFDGTGIKICSNNALEQYSNGKTILLSWSNKIGKMELTFDKNISLKIQIALNL